jgi:nucleotide-binding universal stress UspA family protein
METLEIKQAISLKRILVATDCSAASKVALKYAAGFAARHGSKVYITHVIPPVPRSFIPIEAVPPELDMDRTQADRDMKAFLASGYLEHIEHELLLERGPIRAVLPELIRHHQIDLLVLGTHGRGGISALLLGSVAEEVFRLVSCPVLTVGPAVATEPKDAGHVRQILFATDFGSASLAALPYAISLAKEDAAQLVMLHVLAPIPTLNASPPWYSRAELIEQQEPARQRILDRLAQLIPKDELLSFAAEFVAPFDTLPWGILNVAEEREADLIVMGVNRAAFVRASAHMPWAVAHEIVRYAKCPVLTVHG